jgi:acetyl-CoA carboxylase carboxyl transferase alpha subunit/acetyl-CoA carboxylase carboxyl transferase beta subunit
LSPATDSADRRDGSDGDIPEGLWEECPRCRQLLYSRELEQALWVCSRCNYHFRLTVWQRLQVTADEGSFAEWDRELPLCDPLGFPEYSEKLEAARQKTGMTEAVLTGEAKVQGLPVALGLMDLEFIGGSMGWVVGERITRLMERAIERRLPVVVFCASGGARMQEGLIALMQMARTSGAAQKLAEAGLAYVSVLTQPTYGGVLASYAFLGDVVLAEPGAAMGFAGPRVVEVTAMQIGEGVQTAEYQYEHGMVDMLTPRGELREVLTRLLGWSGEGPMPGLRKRRPAAEHGGAEGCLQSEAAPQAAGNRLSAWERVELARHEDRPYTLDYLGELIQGFTELYGDRRYGDDGAIVAGLGWLDGRPVAIIGHQKGRHARERTRRNFAMARPEGYRKAMRVMRLAEKMGRPIITLIDTPGADCLDEAEARGISEAIAANQRDMFSLGVPIVVVIVGEGGSGGAIGIGVGDRVLMMENSYYSVIAPESCAAILWKDRALKEKAAEALKLTAEDALRLGVIDGIIPEPRGGAQTDRALAARLVGRALNGALAELGAISPEQLLEQRYWKFRRMGDSVCS